MDFETGERLELRDRGGVDEWRGWSSLAEGCKQLSVPGGCFLLSRREEFDEGSRSEGCGQGSLVGGVWEDSSWSEPELDLPVPGDRWLAEPPFTFSILTGFRSFIPAPLPSWQSGPTLPARKSGLLAPSGCRSAESRPLISHLVSSVGGL